MPITVAMLTTDDNPYNPFDDYREWYAFDFSKGYHTPGLLARVAKVSEDLSESDQSAAIHDAIDEIISENLSGIHKKVTREFPDLDYESMV
jgi:hypothetical protein